MCVGEGCLKKESCYRFTAQASERQSFFTEAPFFVIFGDKQGCDYYWKEEKPNAS
jgi:hypothetical protein